MSSNASRNARNHTMKKAVELEKEYTDKITNMYVAACIAMADKLKASKINAEMGPKVIHTRVKSIVENAFEEMGESEKQIAKDYSKQFLLLGSVGAIYQTYKNGIDLILPVSTKVDSSMIAMLLKTSRQHSVLEITKDIENSIKRLNTVNAIAKTYQDDVMAVEIAKAISKATRIMRTEMGRIENKSRYDIGQRYIDNGFRVVKVWDATLDKYTRVSHSEINGERVEYNETFSNGLRYPLDESGAAEEVINCRCKLKLTVYGTKSNPEEMDNSLLYAEGYDDFLKKYTRKGVR